MKIHLFLSPLLLCGFLHAQQSHVTVSLATVHIGEHISAVWDTPIRQSRWSAGAGLTWHINNPISDPDGRNHAFKNRFYASKIGVVAAL